MDVSFVVVSIVGNATQHCDESEFVEKVESKRYAKNVTNILLCVPLIGGGGGGGG